MDQRHKPGMVLLSGNSHPGLAEEVARHLGVGVGSCLVYHNTNRETMVDIQVTVFSISPSHTECEMFFLTMISGRVEK